MAEATVSAGVASSLIELAVSKGVRREDLHWRSGIDPERVRDQDDRVLMSKYVELMHAGQELTGEPTFALEFGRTVHMQEFSILGLIFHTCETVRDAIIQANRYGQLVIDVDVGTADRFQWQRRAGQLWLVDTRPDPNDFPELTEVTFGRFMRLTRQFWDTPLVQEVQVTHTAPIYADAYVRFFEAPTTFDSEWNAMRVDEARLTQRIAVQPRFAFGILSEHAEQLLASLEGSKSARGRIESLLMPILHTGEASMDVIAARMSVSRQTVYRQLKAEGVTFETVLDELRHKLAVHYLSGKRTSVNETAYLVGFSEPAAFSRAFKRWTGNEPAFTPVGHLRAGELVVTSVSHGFVGLPLTRRLERQRGGYVCAVSPLRALSGIDQAVGRTPLVRLDRLFPHDAVWAKLEALNPGGSAKDRSAVALVAEAMASGRLKAGDILVESTSGNFGVALARLAARNGFRFRAVVDPRANVAATTAIRALGGELDLITEPDPATGDWLVARIARVRQLVADHPDAVWLDQYSNPRAAAAHSVTMAEILEALDDRVDAAFVATSTTGTIGGCLQEVHRRGLSTQVFAVDATGSVLFGGARGERRLSGYGAGLVPALAHDVEPHGVVRVPDADAVAACRALARTEGILAGASAGAVIGAAIRILPTLAPGARLALVLHDRGEAYLDTVYSDAWTQANLGLDAADLERRVSALTAR